MVSGAPALNTGNSRALALLAETVGGAIRRTGQEHRPVAVELRIDLFQGRDLGQVVIDGIGLGGVMDQVILVIILGPVKALERLDAGDDGAGKDMRALELGEISGGDLLLLRA